MISVGVDVSKPYIRGIRALPPDLGHVRLNGQRRSGMSAEDEARYGCAR